MPRPREEWLVVEVPAIISEEMFAVAQQRREANKVQMGHQRHNFYALGGMIRCGLCGNAVTGLTRTYGDKPYIYRRYKCGARLSPRRYGFKCELPEFEIDVVDKAVWGWVKSLLLEPDALHGAIEEYQQSQREQFQPQLSMLESSQARLEELERQKTRVIDAYSKGILSLDELAQQKTTLDKEIGELARAISLLRAEAETHLLTAERVGTIESFAAELCEGISAVDTQPAEQRRIFQLLDMRVVLSYDGGDPSAGTAQQRWANVTCVLGHGNCAVEYGTTNNTRHVYFNK